MRRVALFVLCGLAGVSSTAGGAENWPQFHGPAHDAQTDAKRLPLEWGEGHNVTWKTAIPGRAWSSPVVWGRQVWLTTATANGTRMSVLCVDRDSGRITSDIPLLTHAEPDQINAVNSYASPTPVVEAGRLYVHFGSYGTACLETATGRTLWLRRDLKCDHGVGPGSSPLMVGRLLILTFDGMDAQFLAALDKATGKTVWKTKRSTDFGDIDGDLRKAFSTPIVIEAGGRRQLISAGAGAAMAYDPGTGRELWRVRYGRGFSTASRPVFAGGVVVVNSGFSRFDLLAVRPDGGGDVTETHVAWTLRRGPTKTSPIVVGGRLLLLTDRGTLTCVDPATGEQVWRERIRGRFTATPLAAGRRVYLFSEDGTTTVAEAGPQYKQLAVNKLDAGCMASPAVAGEAIILRTKTHLYRIEQRDAEATSE